MTLIGRLRRWMPQALRRTSAERTPGSTRYIIMPTQTGGVFVNEENAIMLSAVFACVTVISKAIASSVWNVFEEDAEGTRRNRRDTPLFNLLNVSPNPEMTAFEFREALLNSALIWQGGYAEIERGQAGQAEALWPLHPDRVRQERDEDGALVYRIHNEQRGDVILPAQDVFRIHGPSIDGLVGYRMARLAARTFGHAIAAETFGAAFFGNGAQMGATLESDFNLTPEQVVQLENSLDEHTGPKKSHKPLILGGGLHWKQQAIEPEKAQFVETRQLLIEEVCRFFGVPPHKIAHLLRSTFTNIEHQGLEFVRDGLTPWAERLRQEAERKLRPANRRSLRTRIELDWLAEGDAKARADADAILVNNGIETRNEVRRRRGLNTEPDGDALTVQRSLTTLDRVGEVSQPAAAVPPGDGTSPPDQTPPAADDEAAAQLPVRVVT